MIGGKRKTGFKGKSSVMTFKKIYKKNCNYVSPKNKDI